MALTTLLHVKPSDDDATNVLEPDIDLYLYGMSAEDANTKVEHVYDTWVRNLPSNAKDHLVVKNAKTITLLPAYPHRRIQIVLKLLPSPTDILLNFDLDACAVGFDGSQVRMLPRSVRALETGYSVFSMDLVWGHHLRERRATQASRTFKYADRGFGIRFLPSYARSLEIGGKLIARHPRVSHDTEVEDSVHFRQRLQREHCPHGVEPGLKTVKRIAYLSKDYVHRYCFGVTPLAISPEAYFTSLWPDYLVDQEGHDEWIENFENTTKELAEETSRSHPSKVIALSELAGEDHFRNLPDGRRGLGNLEIFLRFCEAWKLDANREVSLDRYSSASTVYDSDVYDDIPDYQWTSAFSHDELIDAIDSSNGGY